MTAPRGDRYWSGFFLGVTAAAVAALLILVARWTPELRAMYAEFRAPPLPWPTRAVTSAAWTWILPAALVAAALALDRAARGGRIGTAGPAALAALAVAAVAFTLWAGYLPVFAMAGAIGAD